MLKKICVIAAVAGAAFSGAALPAAAADSGPGADTGWTWNAGHWTWWSGDWDWLNAGSLTDTAISFAEEIVSGE